MEKNYLENKKVSIKIVDKFRSGFSKDSDGRTMYTGCKQIFQCPTNQYDRLIPVLDEQEQRWFEEKMGLERGALSFSNKEKSYWKDFRVTLGKKGKTLDLSDPEDYLSYRVLRAYGTIAKSKDSINVLQHSFYMETEDEIKEVNNQLADKYEQASKLFLNNIGKSEKKMMNALRLLGKNVPPDANMKFLKGELVKIIENKSRISGQPTIDDFIDVASDSNFDTRVFILDAMEIGEVVVDGTTYKLRSGDVIGYDHSQALSYFNNPKNQQSKILIEDRIKNNKA